MKRLTVLSSLLITVTLLALILSSCRTGYGCKGRESWGKMVKRINSK